jgi:excinuclease ABC subunit C
MMKEVVGRRYRRLLKEGSRLPDLILIDGGKGQLSSSLEALAEVGLKDVPVVSIAKREEHIFKPGLEDPIVLPLEAPTIKLIQRVRDEAHRFALSYHRKVRGKRMGRSTLDDIPGIGPRRKEALLRRFGSVRRIRDAGVDDLKSVEGIDETTARKIHSFFNR